MSSMPPSRAVVIVCPLRYEASRIGRGLRSSGMRSGRDFVMTCCGLGESGVARWAERDGRNISARATVLLAGLAGSLCSGLHVPEARVISIVRDAAGEQWTPPLQLDDPRSEPTILVMADRIIATDDDRHALAARSGAQLVDMESAAFARIAQQRGWRWGVVRGVSDDLKTQAPEGMDSWITPDGRLRTLTVLAALARNPRIIAPVRCLHHNSTRALASVTGLLVELLRNDRKIP